ncbi:MAG: hypothetical protein NC321_16725 [Clostridium sp.]|nr:hypothetical protein [Clostridium sp.]
MTKTKEQIWGMFSQVCKDMQDNDERICFHPEQKQVFFDGFQNLYDYILNNCMAVNQGITTLDRHKVTAIITICGIESDFVSMEKVSSGETFLGKEIISLSVALSFMQSTLNAQLKKAGVEKEVEEYTFPRAWTCNTDYFDIMVRNLYYSQRYWKMNPLELAEKFFLLEYITLEKLGINPDILREIP